MKPRRPRHLRLVDDGATDADADIDISAVDVLLTDNSGFDWPDGGDPEVDDADAGNDVGSLPERLKRLAAEVVVSEGVLKGMLHLYLIDPGFMGHLNKTFMGYDDPTDVLAFPIDGPEMAGGGGVDLSLVPDIGAVDDVDEASPDEVVEGADVDASADQPTVDDYVDWDDDEYGPVPVHLGDVMVCPQVAARQAGDHTGSLPAELSLLVIHGVLHILGHDHAEPAEAARMRDRERRHLERLGYRHPVDR